MAYQFSPDPARSRNMRMIKNRDTAPEIALRRALWAKGIRYRKNYDRVPGAPDIAIVGARIAVFVDGAFWHGHDWNSKRQRIRSNPDYWIPKIERTMARDQDIGRQLVALGWTVIRFWDFDIKADVEGCAAHVAQEVAGRRHSGPPAKE